MKKYKLFVLLLLLLVGFVFSAKKGTLPEVMKPDNISVYGNELYVVEGAEISIYSLKDLSLIRKFGRRGEGPGELLLLPNVYYNRVVAAGNYILAESFNKVIFFSKECKLIKEKKKNEPVTHTIPVGKNFVIKKIKSDKDRVLYSIISLYNSDMKEIKELYRQKFFQQGREGDIRINMVMDFVDVRVYDDKIFIEESPRGFVIEVFDSEGKKLYQIEKEYDKLKVTDERKEKILHRFKTDPSIEMQTRRQGGWNALKKTFKMEFPDTFPAIRSLNVSGDKVYVQTFKLVENKDEYVIMDLKGKIIKRVYVPAFGNVPINAEILGVKLHALHNGKLYYLLENVDEEEWELYEEDVR